MSEDLFAAFHEDEDEETLLKDKKRRRDLTEETPEKLKMTTKKQKTR